MNGCLRGILSATVLRCSWGGDLCDGTRWGRRLYFGVTLPAIAMISWKVSYRSIFTAVEARKRGHPRAIMSMYI